jgi:hypothetical protein
MGKRMSAIKQTEILIENKPAFNLKIGNANSEHEVHGGISADDLIEKLVALQKAKITKRHP